MMSTFWLTSYAWTLVLFSYWFGIINFICFIVYLPLVWASLALCHCLPIFWPILGHSLFGSFLMFEWFVCEVWISYTSDLCGLISFFHNTTSSIFAWNSLALRSMTGVWFWSFTCLNRWVCFYILPLWCIEFFLYELTPMSLLLISFTYYVLCRI